MNNDNPTPTNPTPEASTAATNAVLFVVCFLVFGGGCALVADLFQ